jgi:hypothetical protein
MYGPVKIKSVDSSQAIGVATKDSASKKHLSKKKVYLFVFDDRLLITQLPKKSKNPPLGSSPTTGENLVYSFLEAGPISHPAENKDNKFTFELEKETFWVAAGGEEECKKWVRSLREQSSNHLK